MNTSSLLKMGFFDKIATFFDIIPKIIYFLSATLLSGIDILHCMIRKLAGLDVYYVEGVAHAQQDPLSEFIYGILGIGQSAPLYQGLNTVFWSLAIFGVICLVITTMVAIIKSHYNEDTAGTSPMKYIYTAIKAVLAFALIPFVVVFGINLSSFALRTLDQITAGTATEEKLIELYGADGAKAFKGGYLDGQEGAGTKYYSRYDFFGFGAYTSSTTFSGMLFKACAYDANRARGWKEGEDFYLWNEDLDAYAEIQTKDGVKIFANAKGDPDKLAEAFDFAFANNLNLNNRIAQQDLIDSIAGYAVPYWNVTDILSFGYYFGAFSKYDVSFLWWFYNLWSYNFVVAFGGGITMFGIFLSIIIGLFSRLIKGAALFLVYPATLGLAPLDNFKAFRSWGQQFMQQVLMAFGAILGVNLVLLIMPYVQNIQFFQFGLLNYMINVVIVMTAMIMVKDFIGIVSGFVGGGDALTTGAGMKGELGKALGTGIKATAFAGKAAVGVMKATSIPNWVVNGVRKRNKSNKEVDAALAAEGIDVSTMTKKEAREERRKYRERQKDKENQDLKDRTAAYTDLTSEEDSILGTVTVGGKTVKRTRQSLVADAAGDEANANTTRAAFENKLKSTAEYKELVKNGMSEEEAMNQAWTKLQNKKGAAADPTVQSLRSLETNMNDAAKKAEKSKSKLARYDEIQTEKKEVLGDGYVVNKDKGGKVSIAKQNGWDAFWMGGAHGGEKQGGFWRTVGGFAGKAGMAAVGIDRAGMSAAGKEIADGFVKGIREMGAGTGLSGLFKGAKGLVGETFTMKGGVFDKDPKKTGDDLTKSVAEKSEAANKERHTAQVEILKGIKDAIEEMSKKLPGGGT